MLVKHVASQARETPPHLRKPSFWLVHTLGWLVYVGVFAVDNLVFKMKSEVSVLDMLVSLFLSGLIVFFLTIPMRYIYRRCWTLPVQNLILVIGLCSLVGALIWTPAKNTVLWYFIENYNVFATHPEEKEVVHKVLYLFGSVSYSFFMIMVWSSLYIGINYHYRLLTEKEQHLQAVRLSHNAQIKMLRYQINPHFLFNTLNAISTLVLKGAREKANGMLARLSTFLRYSLDNDPEKKIQLFEELKALILYLDIEKSRFDERLSVRFDVDEQAESLLVPSLLLQPLVENSIKYAIAKMPKDGEIEIVAKCVHNLLHLEVADNGPDTNIILSDVFKPQAKQQDGSGVGIRNIHERLMVLYPEQFSLEIISNRPSGMRVIIEIPIEES